MEISLHRDDPESRLIELVAHKVIDASDIGKMLHSYEREHPDGSAYPSIMDLPFRDFVTIVNSPNDFAMVFTWRELAHIDEPKTIGNLIKQLSFLHIELKKIKKAFDKAKMPKLSEAEQIAGFGNANFGFFGIVDMLACRQGVADDVILAAKLRNVIGKLAIVAHKANCEKRLSEMLMSKKK